MSDQTIRICEAVVADLTKRRIRGFGSLPFHSK
jgi:hypothetical protein